MKSHNNLRPTVLEVLPLAREYYSIPGNEVGGNLHVVLEDGNIKDNDIEFCLKQAQEEGDGKGAELAKLLLKMSKTQRLKLCGELKK